VQQVRTRLPLWLIYVLVTAACLAMFLLLATKHNFFDLKIYLSAMKWWADGNELYDYTQPDFLQGKLYFTYPPFAAILLFPFGFLSTGFAAALFTLGTLAAVAVTTKWLFTAAGLPHWPLAVPVIVLMEPLRENIMQGQINMLLIVLIMMDFFVLKGKWRGVGVGLATALKLFPGIFIVYFLVTRQWRAAFVSSVTAAVATLLSGAIAPRASWDFWTSALWDTTRVGRTDYTGNQSLLGMLSRFAAPGEPNRVVWIVLAVAVAAYGLWRAARATAVGDLVAALALTGLVGALVSPITWPHHLYWFVPALVAVLASALDRGPGSRFLALLFSGGYAVTVLGVVSVTNWGTASVPTDTLWSFLARNAFVLFSLVLVIFTPIRHYPASRHN
jgi:alpha-1,2-mannosyltransferase